MKIKSFFKDWCNFWSFAIGLIPTVILYIMPEEITVSIKLFVLVLFLLLLAIWFCVQLAFMVKENEVPSFFTIMECVHGQCICKANHLLSVHSVVTFYHQQGNHEQLIAYGYVETINTKNIAQIKAYDSESGSEEIIRYINDHKENIIIRPTITTDTLSRVYSLIEGEVSHG